MIYCKKEPYYRNSNDYFRDNINHFKISYWEWMIQNYRTVLLNEQGSFSDNPDQSWAFTTEEDRTLFMLRWA
jgi:hypothetical protein